MKFGDPGNVRTAATAASVGGPTRRLEGAHVSGLGLKRIEARRESTEDAPLVGLRCADSARRIPPAVFVSASATLMRTRSPRGAICGVVKRGAESGGRQRSIRSIGANNSRRGFLHRRVIRRRARRDATRRDEARWRRRRRRTRRRAKSYRFERAPSCTRRASRTRRRRERRRRGGTRPSASPRRRRRP